MSVEEFWKVAKHAKVNPIALIPACHPRAPVEVLINNQTRRAVVVCKQCEHPIITCTVEEWHRILHQ